MVSKGKRWGGINEQIQNTICKIGENKDMHRELYSVFCNNPRENNLKTLYVYK